MVTEFITGKSHICEVALGIIFIGNASFGKMPLGKYLTPS